MVTRSRCYRVQETPECPGSADGLCSVTGEERARDPDDRRAKEGRGKRGGGGFSPVSFFVFSFFFLFWKRVFKSQYEEKKRMSSSLNPKHAQQQEGS